MGKAADAQEVDRRPVSRYSGVVKNNYRGKLMKEAAKKVWEVIKEIASIRKRLAAVIEKVEVMEAQMNEFKSHRPKCDKCGELFVVKIENDEGFQSMDGRYRWQQHKILVCPKDPSHYKEDTEAKEVSGGQYPPDLKSVLAHVESTPETNNWF